MFAIALVAIWEGAQLIPTLLNGFVLAVVPAFVARSAAVVCLGGGARLLLFAFRLLDQAEPEPSGDGELSDEYDDLGIGASEPRA